MSTQNPIVIIGAGQSGLSAARAVRDADLEPVILEAGLTRAGSWPHYYESLELFSPARYSSIPGFPFPGDPDRYPTRDEVVAYLESYADTLNFGFIGCRDALPHLQRLAVYTGDALDELDKLA